jgi:hypothetical protein
MRPPDIWHALQPRTPSTSRTTPLKRRSSVRVRDIPNGAHSLAGDGDGPRQRPVSYFRRRSPVVHHLTAYFYNWPVRMWPICRPARGMWGHTHPGVVVSGHTISHGRCAVFCWGKTDQAELQAQTHQKSVSWNVPEVGLAHDPRPGNCLGAFLLHTNHLRTAQGF